MYDLRDTGRLWTFSLERARGSNSMFSISDGEFDEILRLYFKANQIVAEPEAIAEPFRHVEPNLLARLTFDEEGRPKYESTVASLVLDGFSRGQYQDVFGAYSDYLAYVPTSFQKEIDLVLLHSLPNDATTVVAYSIVELKRDRFTRESLSQLLRYEDWFLKRRVGGDSRAIRTVAVARSFDSDVVDYLKSREQMEGKTVNLLRYRFDVGQLRLEPHGSDG
jgi:hypothetical protein